MSLEPATIEKLKQFRQKLTTFAVQRLTWGSFETWVATISPFLRRYFPDDIKHFEELTKTPEWDKTVFIGALTDALQKNQAAHRLRKDNESTRRVQHNVFGFLDTLIDMNSQPAGRLQPPAEAQPLAPEKDTSMPDPKRVFVIYGRNTAAYDEMVKFLRSLQLYTKSFNDVSNECGTSPTVMEIVNRGMEQAAGVIALFTPDEWSVLRPALDKKRGETEESRRWQARPNVIFEAGLAFGKDPKRTILVRLGHDVKLFSDVGGIHYVPLGNDHESRYLLRGRLKAAGCLPDMETGDHLHIGQAGDFEKCVHFRGEQSPGDPFVPPTLKL